ncbi:MAG: hypothetical protein J7527_05100 [Chitinophagaceae bacterium]|nr:hypothetical protein [Chitinophagaceae bacterium]
MKKSNKILLGGFLVVILLITGIHITLYAKYKSGYYTIYKPEDKNNQASMQSFPNVSNVVVRDCGAKIEFGSTLSIDKGNRYFIQYEQRGDSLVISVRDSEDKRVRRGGVHLVLPADVTVSAFNSDISCDNVNDSANIHPAFFLDHSDISFRSPGKSSVLGHVKVNAWNSSGVYFLGNAVVSHLEVELKNSSLEYHDGEIGQLSIATDSSSQLTLQSKHLLKAKITSIPNN